MRQIFSSPRLENVEGVARLLNDEGIETWISEARSYKGNRRRTFSYTERDRGPQPAVWIVRAEDQTRARELLRSAGLIEQSRPEALAQSSWLPASQQMQEAPPSTERKMLRIKMFLLATIAVIGGLVLVRVLG